MKRMIISGFAAVALLFAATMILLTHSHSSGRPVATADGGSASPTAAGKLPLESFEDMSVVYSKPATR